MPRKSIKTATNIIIVFFVAVFILLLSTVIFNTTPQININIPNGSGGTAAKLPSSPHDTVIMPMNTSISSCNNPCDTQPPHNPLSGISVIANSPTPLLPIHTSKPPSTLPVTMCTQSVTSYSHVGILSRDEKVLPLYGRKLERDRWQYYSSTDSHNSMKVPVYINGKDAMNEYGFNELTDGDSVKVTGNEYIVTIYRNTCLQYLPPSI